MGCPTEVEIGDNLVFSVCTHDPDTGVLTDADAVPDYRIYEDETGTAILTGSMAKLDDANTTGFYSESIACTSGNGFENGKTYTIYIEATVDSDEGGMCYGFKAYDHRKSNMLAISDDETAADNLEATYDGTGYADDNAPATQAQIGNIANVGSAVNVAASSYTLTTGKQTANSYTDTDALNGTRHTHTDDTGEMELYYEFNVGGGVPSSVTMTGKLTGNNDNLFVRAYDWIAAGWVEVGLLDGRNSSSNEVDSFDLLVSMVGTGSDIGKVRVQFIDLAYTLSSATLYVDQIFVSFSLGSGDYANGAIWVNTNVSNTNTVPGVDGVTTNPVSTWAAALTLSSRLNIDRFQIANGSSITLTGDSTNFSLIGIGWTLALGGQIVAGMRVTGAVVTGTGTGSGSVFTTCNIASGATLTIAQSFFLECGIAGSVVLSAADTYYFDNCFSGVAGTATPDIDFGAAVGDTNLNMRHYSGGIEIKNMGGAGTDKMSLEGDGQIVINANCSAGTVAIRGNFTVTDNAGGALTLSDDARIDVDQVADAVADEEYDNDGSAISLRGAIKLLLSVLTGKSSGGGTSTNTFRDIADSKNRVSATVDSDGNRTAVGTRDGS